MSIPPNTNLRVTDPISKERGVDVNARRYDHLTPLHLASRCGKLEIVQILLDHGANPNVEDKFFMTPLHHVAAGEDKFLMTPLPHVAAWEDDFFIAPSHHVAAGLDESQEHGVPVAQLLLQCGVDVNAQDSQCETPLHLASASGRLEIVRVLLEHATVRNDCGQNPSPLVVEGKRFLPKIILVLTVFF